jgi:small subunit ribosomal protein S21
LQPFKAITENQQQKIYYNSNMIIINVKENESIDKALKRFKKKFERTGVLKELRSRTYFEKPSITRRTEKIKAAYKQNLFAQENY